MAGTPKKRARKDAHQLLTKAAELANQETPAPVLDATAVAPDARARAREAMPLRPPPAPLRPPNGTATRNAVDQKQVNLFNELAKHMRPGLTIRIERVRPHWCAGYIEDYPLEEPDSLGVFYNYLRDEHGGQFYRLTVLAAGEQQLYQAQMAIAGPPLERGRPINRQVYEGHETVRANPQPRAAAPASQDSLAPMMTFVQLFIEQMRESNRAQLDSVRQMVTTSSEQTSALAAAVLQVRNDAKPPSLADQLGEVMEATRAVDSVRKALGATTQRAGAAELEEDDDDGLRAATREATKGFVRNVVGNMFGGGGGGQQPPAQAPQRPPAGPRPVGPLRPIRQQSPRAVKDAVAVPGQSARKN